MKAKRHGGRGEIVMEDRLEDMPDGPKNAKITLSFPLSAAPLPLSLTSPSHRRSSSSSSSPSPQRRRQTAKCSDEGALWKLDSTTDVKHRPFKPPRHDSSPSSSPSSSSSSMTAHTLIRKDIKSPPPLKCSKLSPEFHRSPPSSSSGGLESSYSGDVWDERPKLTNGAASHTAQILFSLGSAYNRPGDTEGRDKVTRRPAGKPGGSHGPSLHPPSLHLPPPLPPPPPSEGLTAPSHPSSYSPSDSLKPELICGVCHRLFSTAASLTVHMRLHRGSRALSCRYCGKVFIHSKRLQSHEASCRVPELPSSSLGPPSLTMQPKEEPLEEGEVRVEGGVIVAQADITKARSGKKAQSLLAQIQSDDAAAAELLAGDEHHFVKVVDGNVIYFCSVCERSYMTLSSLKRHSNVHSWRRKYPCHYCDKVFALAEYRTKHEVWHTGERRYQCIFCWDAFATYYNLKTHQKTIHGINPSLISSEKTANGGYKQKANALKLYRLLPMRSQKRPYKTYSDSLHNGLLLQPAETPLPVPGLDCALGSGDLQSLLSGAHPQTVKPDPDDFPDSFPVTVPAEERDHSGLPQLSQTDISHIRKHDGEASEIEQGRVGGSFKMSSSSRTKMSKTGRCPDTIMPSVITYGHTKPSVIVHGTSVSSSVIVHSNQVTSGNDKSDYSSSLSSSQAVNKSSPRSIKKQRDSLENHRKRSRDSSDTAEDSSRGRRDTDMGTKSLHKSRKLHSKSEISTSKQESLTLSSPSKDTGPLCQITVRIGEEAIVKRSISETDLKRDKSHSPPKNKRSETSSGKEVKDSRHSHSHHHHKHHRASLDVQETHEKEEVRKHYSPDRVREYYFRQEVREQQDSDHDNEDNLWRPYYSYKPKRKAQAHLQRVKSWQRKLKFKRSLRLKRRVDRLKNFATKDTEKSNNEEEEGISDGADKILQAKKQRGIKKTYDFSVSKEKKIDADKKVEEAQPKTPPPAPSHQKSPQSTSAAPTAIKRRPWTSGNAAECGTCGRWFSSSRKRDKHELSHLLEFVCLFCRATFPSTEKLEDHQKAQHPKPVESPSQLVAPKAALTDPSERVKLKQVPVLTKYEDKGSHAVDRISSPSRLSRRALSRHTCPQCHKVCKTSSALNRHIRRHELSSSPERDDKEPKTQIISRELQNENEQVPLALSVSVINYSPSELPSSNEHVFQNDIRKQSNESKMIAENVFTEPKETIREPTPQNDPPLDQPINLAPSKPEFPLVTQSVLIRNESKYLDYHIPSKQNFDAQSHKLPSPVQSPNNTRITTVAPPPVSMTTAPTSEAGYRSRDGVIIDRDRQYGSDRYLHPSFEEPPLVHHLRVQPQSRCQSPNEAQDLTMSSLRAREREMEKEKEREKRVQQIRKHALDNHNALLVPKEEPLSPVPSPHHMPAPTLTTVNGNSAHRHTPRSPCLTPLTMGQPAEPTRQAHSTQTGQRPSQPDGTAVTADRPSAHALPLPRAPKAPADTDNQDNSRDFQQVEDYPDQEYPLPLTVPDSYRSDKKHDDTLLMPSYSTGGLPFGPLGKVVVPNGADLSKIPFYPDPYPLLYGPQLLAYPYNLAALPVALNMMAPGGDKVEPLPFLPAIFNYATGPYMGAAPHPLVANTTLYSNGSSGGKKQRDSTSKP